MNIMKDIKLCEGKNRRAYQFNAMKIRIILGLSVVLGAGSISVRAADNPAQAAARVVLEQKLSQPDAWDPQPLTPAAITLSRAAVEQPVKSAANATGTVSEKGGIPQTAPAPTAPMAAAPAAVAAMSASPDLLFLLLSLMTISFLIMSFLLLKLLRQNSRHYDSEQPSPSSRT